MARFEENPAEFVEKVVYLNRVSKTVKGGRVHEVLRPDGGGRRARARVGFGLGKAAEVPEAIRKGIEDAKKNMITVSLAGTTIPHEVIGEFGAGRVLMKPAAPGTGVIAGGRRPCRHGSRRHQGHPHQVPALQQPAERGLRDLRGPEVPQEPRGGGPHPRQERGRDRGLRRTLPMANLNIKLVKSLNGRIAKHHGDCRGPGPP